MHDVAGGRLGDLISQKIYIFHVKGCLRLPPAGLSPGFCSQELLVLDIQFHNGEEQESRATVGKRPAAPEPAVATVLQDTGFSVGQQRTKPRAGPAPGPPRGPRWCVCCTASDGESKRHRNALHSEGIAPAKIKSAVGLAWPGFVVQVMADLLE